MSKQLTLASGLAIAAMAALAFVSTAQPISGGDADHAGTIQAKLPQIDEDALGLLMPWYAAR